MATESQTNRIIIFCIVNIILLSILYLIPINNNTLLENLCIYKNIFGVECWNCGMTRAFLSILHGDFQMAIQYNKNSIIVFYSIYKIYDF